MSNDIDDPTASYLNELAQCDRDDRAAENAEMCAPALIFISLGIAVASFTAHETIGGTLGIIGVIAGFVWRSDLKAKAIARSERRSYIRRALESFTYLQGDLRWKGVNDEDQAPTRVQYRQRD